MLILTIFIIFCQNAKVLVQHTNSDFTTNSNTGSSDESALFANFDLEGAIESSSPQWSKFTLDNLDNEKTTTTIKCVPNFDNLKVIPDKVSTDAYLTWDSNNTDACDYKYKVTTRIVSLASWNQSDYVTGQNYTAKNIKPCVKYNFTVELQQKSDNKTLYSKSDILETDTSEDDKVNNVTYAATTDSIFLQWVPSPNAKICKIQYQIILNLTNSVQIIPYFRLEPKSNHLIPSLNSCTYYNVTIRSSDWREDGEKDKDPLMYLISTLPDHVTDLKLSVSGNFSRVTWNPPSNRECLKSYNITIANFAETTFETHFETNQNLFCTTIVIYPISKDGGVGKPAAILKPGLVQNVTSFTISHEEIRIYWDPPINKNCVDGYAVKVTNHSTYDDIDKNTVRFTIENLTACTTYEIKLYAITNKNDFGDPYILYSNTSAPHDVGPVENLTGTVDGKIVTLNWNPPSNAKTCNLTYRVEVYDEHNEKFRDNPTSQTTQTINFTGAIYCSQYTVRVITVTLTNLSEPNEFFIEIPEVRTAPSCTAENVNITRAVLKCKFEDFAKNVCPIETLNVRCNNIVRTASNLSNRTDTIVTFENLDAFSHYECTAVANTISGESPSSNSFSFRTMEGVPDAPEVENIEADSNTSFWIFWKEVKNIRGEFKKYEILVESLRPTYFISSQCQLNVSQFFEYHELSINNTSFLFTQAVSSYKYKVTIRAATDAGYGPPSVDQYIYTKGGIPEEPRSTSYTPLDFTRERNYNVSVLINWVYPCITNGNVSHFRIEISGKSAVGDLIDDHLVEKNVSVNDPITNLNYEYTLENLKPAFCYNISIQVVTEDNLESIPEIIKFNSTGSFPEAPTIKLISEVTRNTFSIEWDSPKEKRGQLRKYVVLVESVKPNYCIPHDCAKNFKNDTCEVPGNVNSFTYKKGTPYSTYQVYVTAVNIIGSSPLSGKLITTTPEAEPEEVRNLEVKLEDSQTEDYYAAMAIVTFDHPCHTYGDFQSIDVNLLDNETHSWTNYSFKMISGMYEKRFPNLPPERSYTLFVQVYTTKYRSDESTRLFKTATGIPLLHKPITSPVPQESGTATFTLSKDIFDERNGHILYYAIILGEVGNNEKSMFGKLRNTGDWPELAENLTANDKMKPYQVTPKDWNPFEDNDLTNVTITLGDNSYEGNKPLVQSVSYTIKVRGFTENGYRDSPTVTFKIPEENKLGLILGLTFGIMGTCAMFFLIFIIWKKRQNWTKKKESIKSIPLTPIPISISNFSQYYSDLQDNGERLKMEFLLLASKSSEIVANFCDATLPENKKKNRYTNILPYDESRVKLLTDNPDNEEEEQTDDYINASYVNGYSGSVEYIATQGPLEHTVMDFWRMVTQENSSLIVMVAQFVEQNKDKCYKYFPNLHENIELEHGLAIRCCSELNFKNYVVRTFMVQKDAQQWTVTHLQFTDWPDFGCPAGTEVIIEFCQLMREHAGRNQDPIIIHCSAGVGRTGTLIALDILLQAMSNKSDIDIFGTVLNLRRDRKNMVQTEKQYLFIHNCIDDVIQNPTCISREDEVFSTEPIYENLNGINNGQLENHMQESKF